jgi:hypothetical protein
MGARKVSYGGHFRAWMYEDRRVKKHHASFESRDGRGERYAVLTVLYPVRKQKHLAPLGG